MKYPLKKWKIRHYFGLYVLSRFVLKPVMYFPGILSFYYILPGRRFNNLWTKVPVILPKLMSPVFWKSGSHQGYMRLPINGERWKEACGDWAVFLMMTWPLWLWTRIYFGYFIIEYASYRIDINPDINNYSNIIRQSNQNQY
mmetsp:Transcript_14010/g.17252  ORF Transcript_14010/g.17252 Transcript_14010/m.17252 type:complete len:142 (-) Transcript_14010:67-492(-)